MTLKSHTHLFNETVDINMTCLQGKITTTYDELCKVFGYPTMTDGDPYEKVNVQWKIESLQFLLQMILELKTSIMWLQQSTIGKLDISLLKNMNGTLVVSNADHNQYKPKIQ